MSRKKKTALLSVALSATMLASAFPAIAAPATLDVEVNGKKIEFASNAPIAQDGTTFVPLESTSKALNLSLQDAKNGTITAVIDGKQVTLQAKPKTIGGVTYVPVRIIGEAAGYEVRWDAASRTIELTSKIVKEGGKGFLWEVKNGGNTIYLVGSMHIADDSFYPLHPSFEEAFAESDYLAVEVDITSANESDVQKLVEKLGSYQDGTTLKDHISAETYKQLGEILVKNNLKADALDKFKPWVVETTIATLKSMEAGYQSTVGIDLHFIQKAMERKIPVIELETYESQLTMFNSFSKDLQEANLKTTLDNFELVDESVDQMADMWKKGDDAALLKFTESMSVNEEYRKAMLDDRNIAMAAKIDGFLKGTEKAEYFVVVGAAHYLGDTGIVKLLQDKGYTVTRK
ncbi:TraB/GumN family protein [Paenibacillus xanthanilyticus]|uniref:TraB/GumN family protein n=1 Tax=Paenibacillus xanthanilyticus TaxID=1783531 RepID=A0ABV8JXS2_9BACL